MTFYTQNALLDVLQSVLRQTPPGDSFTLQFSWWDWQGREVQRTVTLLEEIARNDGLSLRLDVTSHRSLRVTRLDRPA